MASFNKVILLGNLTRDPEVRYTPKGTAVTELGMAVNRVYTAENGEKREETTFVDVTLWWVRDFNSSAAGPVEVEVAAAVMKKAPARRVPANPRRPRKQPPQRRTTTRYRFRTDPA
jgi:hypothetical protein